MTDRSSTESKTNRLLETSKTDNVETHHFKCAVHPLLQFSDVCQKEILKYEKVSRSRFVFDSVLLLSVIKHLVLLKMESIQSES
jgi:hypothetical protein